MKLLLPALAAALLLSAAGCEPAASSKHADEGHAPTSSIELMRNVGFEGRTRQWSAEGAVLSVVEGRHDGNAVRLSPDPATASPSGSLHQTSAGTTFPVATQVRAAAWVRTDRPDQRVRLRLVEVPASLGSSPTPSSSPKESSSAAPPPLDTTAAPTDVPGDVGDAHTDIRTVGNDWQRVTVTTVAHQAGSAFELVVGTDRLDLSALTIDAPTVHRLVDPLTPVVPGGPTLSNGCERNRRGVPVCSAYVGGAYGGNDDPAPWEVQLEHGLGLRRTYWSADDRSRAVQVARSDLEHRRLPWLSFKLPYSWTDMADGRGDQWLTDLARSLAELPGPVWLALHHEPEGDGSILEWRRMQEHCAPLVRLLAPNVGFTVILTGYNQLYGPREFHLDRIWPRTKVDVAGFDVYNTHGQVKDGQVMPRSHVTAKYLRPLSDWASDQRVAWALGESGYTALAARRDPTYLRRTVQDLIALHGVAFAYFNSDLNSSADWRLNTPAKARQFREVHELAPRLVR